MRLGKRLGFGTGGDRSELVTIEGQGGGRSTPSYSNVVSNRGKEPSWNKLQNSMENETKTTSTQKLEGSKPHEKEGTHKEVRKEMKVGDSGQRMEGTATMGPFKPKSNIKLRVVLNDPSLQAHRDHMATYVVMCKFMSI